MRALFRMALAALVLFCAVQTAYAAPVQQVTTYYYLDTGVTFLWKTSGGVWQNGLIYGSGTEHAMSHAFSVPEGAVILHSGKYVPGASRGERGYFPFEDTEADETAIWSRPVYGRTKLAYDLNYAAHAANMSVNSADGDAEVRYGMSFPLQPVAVNVKAELSREGGKDYIYALLDSPSADLMEKMNLLDPTSEHYASSVEGYMYFTPTVIAYQITEWVDDEEKPAPPEEEPDVSGSALLHLPEYTYAGHPVPAEDRSNFSVEGSSVTAADAYARGLARSSYSTSAAAYTCVKDTSTTAVLTFADAGTYTVTLSVRLGGQTLTSTRSITVYPTPSVEVSVGGKQKANRRQTLEISVAKTPGVALSSLWVELENLDGSETVRLAAGGPADVGNEIKTRALAEISSDKYFSRYRLEFLTKNEEAYSYVYRVYAEDAEGESDSASGVIAVAADLAPACAIDLEPEQLRQAGTNVAAVAIADASTADSGDSLSRSWSWIDRDGVRRPLTANVTDYSFGAGQSLVHNVEGVGELTYCLTVTDVWQDETLPEFVDPQDYLSASAEASTDVVNVAPVVSLELKNTEKLDLAVVAGSAEDRTYIGESALKRAIVEANLDADVRFVDLPQNLTEDPNLANTGAVTINHSMNTGLNWQEYQSMFESAYFFTDEDRLYILEPHYRAEDVSAGDETAMPAQPFPFYCYDVESGGLLWSTSLTYEMLPIDDSSRGHFAFDGCGRYVFFVSNGGTAIFSIANGAHLCTLDFELGYDNYSSEAYIYSIKADGVYSVSTQTAAVKALYEGEILTKDPHAAPPRNTNGLTRRVDLSQEANGYDGYSRKYGGTAVFYARTGASSLARASLNLANGDLSFHPANFCPDPSAAWLCMGFDSAGNALVSDVWETGNYVYKYGNVYFATAADEKVSKTTFTYSMHDKSAYGVKDEYGVFAYVVQIHQYGANGQLYINVDIYDLATGSSIGSITKRSSDYPSGYQVVYAQKRGGYIYVVEAIEAYTGVRNYGVYVYGSSYVWVYNMADRSYTNYSSNAGFEYMSLGSTTEDGRAHDGNVAVGWILNGNSGYNGRFRVSASSMRRTADRVLSTALREAGTASERAGAVLFCDSANTAAADVERTTDLLAASGKAAVFVVDNLAEGPRGYAANLYDALLSAGSYAVCVEKGENWRAEATERLADFANLKAKEVLKLTATGEGDSSVSAVYDLENDTKYYYEYYAPKDCKAEFSVLKETDAFCDDTGEGFTDKRYYVTGSEVSDYTGDGAENGFFALGGNYLKADGRMYIADLHDGNALSAGGSMSFTVPEGKQAVLSIDYSYVYRASPNDIILFVDGERWKRISYESVGSGAEVGASYTHPELLEAGEHTLQFHALAQTRGYNNYFALKRIKLVYVEETEKGSVLDGELAPDAGALNKKADKEDDGWVLHSGSFTTLPEEICYASQQAVHSNYNISSNGDFDLGNGATATKSGNINAETFTMNLGAAYAVNTSLDTRMAGGYSSSGGTRSAQLYWTDEGAQKVVYPAPADAYGLQAHQLSGEFLFNMSPQALTGTDAIVANGSRYTTNRIMTVDTYTVPTLYAPVAEGKYFAKAESGEICFPNLTASGRTRVTISSGDETWEIAGFRIYKLVGGRKVYLDEEAWELTNATAETGRRVFSAEEDEVEPLVYEKGELVNYAVQYSDYENDPSKASYWVYTHTPLTDGENPDAAYIEDKYGNVRAGSGGVLSAPIERFHIDGKYTVAHWQEDDTGNADYDRESNRVELTFFVKGEALAGGDNSPPEILLLATDPAKPEDGDGVSILAEVFDADGDTLVAVIEVLKDGRKIYTWRNNALAPAEGRYPLINVALPGAVSAGSYTVVCTVYDDGGADMDSLSFFIKTEKSLTASVGHTETWNEKRLALGRPEDYFFSGETFVLNAEAKGNPLSVTCEITDTGQNTRLTPAGETDAFAGSLREGAGRRGRSGPEVITFLFTAAYADGKVLTCAVEAIVDDSGAPRLHRLY